MNLIDRAAQGLARALAAIGLGALLCFAAMTIADGLLRFFVAHPIDAVRDVGGLVAAFAVSCCIPVAIIERSNITIRFISNFISPYAGRFADAAAAILVDVVLILIAWQFVIFAMQAQATGAATWMLRIPAAPFWWGVAAMFWVSALLQALIALKTARGDFLDRHAGHTG